MKLTTDRILDDLLDVSERLTGPAPRFLKLLDAALEAKLAGDNEGLAVTLFRLGLVLGTDEHRKLTLGDHRHRQRGRQGGKSNARSEDEKRQLLTSWTKEIAAESRKKPNLSKRQIMDRASIPYGTYYQYRRELSKTKKTK